MKLITNNLKDQIGNKNIFGPEIFDIIFSHGLISGKKSKRKGN